MYKIAELEQYFVEEGAFMVEGLTLDIDRHEGGVITAFSPIQSVGIRNFVIIDREESIQIVYRTVAMGREEAIKRLLAYYAQTMIENVGEGAARDNLAAVVLEFVE